MTKPELADFIVGVYEHYYPPLALLLWEFKLKHRHDPSPDELRTFILSGRAEFCNEWEHWKADQHEQNKSGIAVS